MLCRVSEQHIWRSAHLLVEQHGDDALNEAIERVFQMKERGDTRGMEVWRRVAQVISPSIERAS
jgi:hypothetical protein